MPLAEHLRELRNRLMKSVLAILAVCIVAMVFYLEIADFLIGPTLDAVGCDKAFGEAADEKTHCANFVIDGLTGPFTVMLKIALTAGLVIASPVWLWQLWGFLAPGLHRHEKKYARAFVATGVPLFLSGAYLAYLILPTAARALLDFSPDDTNNLFQLDEFIDIISRLVIVFGLAFELPLVLVMLNFGGIVTGRKLLGWWRIMVVAIALFSAVATPTGDPLTMAALAAPIVGLYFGAVGICFFNDRRRRQADPFAGLDDDEASDLDHVPEDIGAPADGLPGANGNGNGDDSGGSDGRRNGYGDAT